MEILNKKYALLTNHEVMAILQNSWEDKKKKHGMKNLATISYETLQYLTESPAPIKSQTTENILEFRTEMRRFNLSDNEIFMMVNDPPTSLLHIQLLIEDSEERLSEDQVTEILQINERLLMPPPTLPEADPSEQGDNVDDGELNQDDDGELVEG